MKTDRSPRRSRSSPETSDLAKRVLSGDRAAAARAITLLENADPSADDLLKRLYPAAGRAWVVGVTGPAGVGKSTLVAALLEEAAKSGVACGALLVDPSSPFSGGALLGDRLRLAANTGSTSVFVRSLASRGEVGGLAASVWGARRVLDALGLDLVVLETVGAGQADVEIARCADTVAVVLMPGMGDDVQALKAGLLEIADVLIVNKADHPDRDRALATLRTFWAKADRAVLSGNVNAAAPSALSATLRGQVSLSGNANEAAALRGRATLSGTVNAAAWEPPIMPTVATRGEGVPRLWAALREHRMHLDRSGEGLRRRRAQAEAELGAALARRVHRRAADGRWTRAVEGLLARRVDPSAAAKSLLGR